MYYTVVRKFILTNEFLTVVNGKEAAEKLIEEQKAEDEKIGSTCEYSYSKATPEDIKLFKNWFYL